MKSLQLKVYRVQDWEEGFRMECSVFRVQVALDWVVSNWDERLVNEVLFQREESIES